MGLFSKKCKPHPVIETHGLRIEYKTEDEFWRFTHDGVEFVSYGTAFVVPAPDCVSSIVADVERLGPEMRRRVGEFWKDHDGVKINDGETFFVDLTQLHAEGSFDVSWSGGKSWGDMAIDFTILNHEIANETWGD
jgi:hypothetical protein